jgi:hypothetical protein
MLFPALCKTCLTNRGLFMKILCLLVLNLLIAGPALAARLGPGSSGGGNSSIAFFVASAEALLKRVKFQPTHAALLQSALKSAHIEAGRVLLTPGTSRPVSNQEGLLAYGSPGLIQLKLNQPGEESFEKAVAEGRPLAHIVIHELFRASGAVGEDGNSIDDAYQLTIGFYRLNKLDAFGNVLIAGPRAYWQCQCFAEGDSTPVMGDTYTDLGSLLAAEARLSAACEAEGHTQVIGRCLRFYGDATRDLQKNIGR